MGNLLYRFFAAMFQAFIWGGEVEGEENLPKQGPVVLVANHLGALGPIAVAASVPRRLYPWIIVDMLDAKRAAEYMRWDFVEREMHLPMPFSLWLAKVISKVSVPLLNYVGCVPVYPDSEGLRETFQRSVDLLAQNCYLVVFPEDPNRPRDPRYNMTSFRKGFVRLGELYFQRTGKSIQFCPLAVHRQSRCVRVGKPVTYNPYTAPVQERLRVKNILEEMIHEMYLELNENWVPGALLPH